MLASSLRDAADWIASRQTESIHRLRRWCDQNSSSLDAAALAAMADILSADFAASGVELSKIQLPQLKLLGDRESWDRQATGPALLWHHQPEASRRLLLMIHYDTVYAADSEPHRCTLEGTRLVGPGTADAKGGIAVIALAVEAILKFDLAGPLGLSILLNPDEEIGSTASYSLMQSLAGQFEAALLFEPSLPDGSLVAARKGSGGFGLVVRGRSAHAGRNPEQGRNAIVHLSKLVPELTRLQQDDDRVLLNIGRVAGGGPLNRVPDHAVLQLNVRVADRAAMQRIEAELAELARRFTDEDYRVTLTGAFHSPPKVVDEKTQSLQRLVEQAAAFAGRRLSWRDTGGACDGSKLADMGLANIDTMGVAGGDLHSPLEFCETRSLVPAATTVAALVAGYGGGSLE